MTSPEDITQEDEMIAQLSAYLDGELSPAEAEKVERELAGNQTYREELRHLQQSWDLLDELPMLDADDTFAQTTLEMVVAAARDEIHAEAKAESKKKPLLWFAGAAVVLSGFLLGFAIIREVGSWENNELVRDLPMLEQVDSYRYVEDVEFLEKLDASELFSDEVDAELGGPDDAT